MAEKHKFIKGIVGGLDLTQVFVINIIIIIIITKNIIIASVKMQKKFVNNLVKNKGDCTFNCLSRK